MRVTGPLAAALAALLGAAGAAHAAPPQPPPPADILTAPTRIARTAGGDVGYREVGTGSPLVLITGHGATMDTWAPDLVDGLAAHHRVIVFDNPGIGASAPSAPTVPAMADRTAALIDTLHLHRPAVLGWSMGGFVAQALAVRHPGDVGRLVLAATMAGDGRALPVPPAAAAALDSPNPAVVLSVLFPADQGAALRAYAESVLEYPDRYSAPAAVKADQTAAGDAWMAGRVAAGHELRRVRVPVLVADGAADAVNPPGNTALLAADLPHGARTVAYPDAGHAFLFQDAPRFVDDVDRFLHQR